MLLLTVLKLFSDVAYVVVSAVSKEFYGECVICGAVGAVGKGEMNSEVFAVFFCGNKIDLGVFCSGGSTFIIVAAGFGIVIFGALEGFSGNTEIFCCFAFKEICGICVNFSFEACGHNFDFIGVFGSGNDPGVVSFGSHCGAIFNAFAEVIEAAFSGNNDGTVVSADSAEVYENIFIKSGIFFVFGGFGFVAGGFAFFGEFGVFCFLAACGKSKNKHKCNYKCKDSFHKIIPFV